MATVAEATAAVSLPALTHEEIARYSRHLILPEVGMEGQQKLKAAKVLLVGTGGLGSPLAFYLAAAGVGTLGLVDFDVVDASNLHRQVIHSDARCRPPEAGLGGRQARSAEPGSQGREARDDADIGKRDGDLEGL